MKSDLVRRIREAYPRPSVSMRLPLDSDYCVGGALCRSVMATLTLYCYPQAGIIASVLQDVNPALKSAQANIYAIKVINANDSGEFERAWELLDEAVSWPFVGEAITEEVLCAQ